MKQNSSSDTHPLHRDHPAMQLSPVKVADTLGGLLCGRHGDKTIAASPGALGVCHHLSSNNLHKMEAGTEVEKKKKSSILDQI